MLTEIRNISQDIVEFFANYAIFGIYRLVLTITYYEIINEIVKVTKLYVEGGSDLPEPRLQQVNKQFVLDLGKLKCLKKKEPAGIQ